MINDLKNIDLNNYVNYIDTELAVVGINNGDILEIRFKLDEYEVSIENQEEIQKAVVQLTNSGAKRFHIIVIPGLFGGISKEARDKEMFDNSIFSDPFSISIVVNNISQRILGNFYLHLKKKKPNFPYKLFASEELAIAWINSNK